jgi:hypothetical protein
MVDHAHDLSRLDRLGEMHLETGRQRSCFLVVARMCRDGAGRNR